MVKIIFMSYLWLNNIKKFKLKMVIQLNSAVKINPVLK